jgi:hypothetical protein
VVVDSNRDGRLDLATANGSRDKVTVLLNRGARRPGDIDDDGDVDHHDLIGLLMAYGTCVGDPNYDPNGDFDQNGRINLSDLATLLAFWGGGV